MIRTKDLFVLGIMVVFLLGAIVVTVWLKSDRMNPTTTDAQLKFAEVADAEPGATLGQTDNLSREDRLAHMREQVALSQGEEPEVLVLPQESDEVEGEDLVLETGSIPTAEEEVVAATEPKRCVQYSEYVGAWPATNVQMEVVEGSRLYFTEQSAAPALPVNASSTLAAPSREVYLQLPLPALPAAVPACLASDVIGIAKDGSLIRNNEAALYSVFGPETLIGYALDGFPIYGVSQQRGDACGGVVDETGQYKYYLSAEREAIITCFAAIPATL